MGSKNYNKGSNKDTKLVIIKIVTTPIRILVKARDMYVKSMNGISSRAYTSSMGFGPDNLPRSFNVNSVRPVSTSDHDDFSELVRVASVKKDLLGQQQNMPTKVPRSRTVAFGRIDEDEEYDFSIDDNVNSSTMFYPRSRSVAVGQHRPSFVF
ncbi:hypothetical protein ACFE04_022755 [Oxalis oulophora]